MTKNLKALATLALAATVAVGYAQSTAGSPTPKRSVHHRKPVPKKPSVESQIDELRQEMESQRGQIDTLKQQLSDRDTQLQQAQQAAQSAQQSAQSAQQAANAQQQTLSANTEAVSSLQSSVSDLKANSSSIVSTIQTNQAEVKKEIENPEALHYKGVTLSPAGSFVAAETVNRTAAADSGINTAFTGVPLQHSEAYQLSEFYGTGRQSRIALTATGKLPNMTLIGHWEADWLSAGVDSNNNQSNSYTLRQRAIYGEAKLNDGWDFSGGTGWDLAAETTKGLERGTEILPATIDAQYEPGFVWTRQYSFRVTKDFGHTFFAGISIENAETLNPAGQNLPTNLLIGAAGAGGGHYNLNANYSFNYAPDLVAKIAVEPGWGHWELFGIERNFRDRIYPATGAPYNSDPVVAGGVGGGFRAPLDPGKKITIGLKGLYGEGVGRYGSSTIADVTVRPDGTLSPLHGFSALSTVELNPTKRLMMYFNYGGDYVRRDYSISGGKQIGYGTYTADMSGCLIEPSSTAANPSSDPTTPGNSTNKCSGNNKDVQEFTAGYWYNFYSGPKGRLRQGIQYSLIRRDLWSGAGGTLNPGGGAYGDDNMVFTSFRYYLP
jgi:TolA-binding protein